MKPNLKIIGIASIVFLFAIGAFVFYGRQKAAAPLPSAMPENTSAAINQSDIVTDDKVVEDATKGVLPDIQTNPLDEKPDLNPVDKTNPYKNIKTNPFK